MDRLRHVLRPRWIIGLVLALLVAALCVWLGFWQLERLEQRRAYNQRVQGSIDAPPTPLDTLLSAETTTAASDGALDYRRVQVSGRYQPEHERVLFGRPLDGQPGNHVLTPLATDDGKVLVVDRGWVPLEMDTPPVEAAVPPAGTVQLEGFLVPAETTGPPVPDGSPTAKVNLADFGDTEGEVLPLYLRLSQQTPASGDLPRAAPLESLGEGPHLGYAVQWFIFAVIAIGGFAILVRKDLRDARDPEVSVEDDAETDRSG